MIIGLLKNGDRVTGAVGMDLYEGCLLQFEAKEVVLGTGGYQPYSLKNTNSDMTGDGQAMAYRAGARLADMEFMLFLITAVEPNEMRGSILPVICTFRDAFDYDPGGPVRPKNRNSQSVERNGKNERDVQAGTYLLLRKGYKGRTGNGEWRHLFRFPSFYRPGN